jgi:hypothetical protein
LQVKFNCSAVVYGTKGCLTIPDPFWCSQKLEMPSGTFDQPFPEAKVPFNYTNSAGS